MIKTAKNASISVLPSGFAASLALFSVALIAAPANPLAAQQQTSTENRALLGALEQCATIEDNDARLACYDGKMRNVREITEQSVEERRAQAEAEFGLGKFDIARRDEQRVTIAPEVVAREQAERELSDPAKIETKLVEVYANNVGKRIFILENGQTWQETGNSNLRRIRDKAYNVEVSKSGFGGYRIKLDGVVGFAGVIRVK